jgi:hypothetical protein
MRSGVLGIPSRWCGNGVVHIVDVIEGDFLQKLDNRLKPHWAGVSPLSLQLTFSPSFP